jgi:ABC-type sugar transport system ATPase subunit
VSAPLLEGRGLYKRFAGVVAVAGLDFTLRGGEILALLGRNGAGKSTLMQMLAGVHARGSWEGEMTLAGRPFHPASVAEAEARGVALVPQEVNVVGELSVAENMFLHAEPRRFGLVDQPARLAAAGRALRDFDVEVDPAAPMASLDLATQQLVVIARALSKDARVLILDEPTAALTERESQRLFVRMRALRARGVSCLFVSHRLAEVFAIADRILVMRDGRVAGQFDSTPSSTPGARDQVVQAMLGASASIETTAPAVAVREAAAPVAEDPPALEVRDLVAHDPGDRRRPPVDGVTLSLRRGEILGLFGLLGAGCGELALAIYGAWPGRVEGQLRRNGRPLRVRRPRDAVAAGIGLVAQDRRDSLIAEHSVAENLVLASMASLGRLGLLDVTAMRQRAALYLERLAIKAPDVDTPVGALSGGNQQKVQVARWLAAAVQVLLLVDPTRGIDVGARAEIDRLWRALAAEGHALLLVSSEAEEIAGLCHRTVVLRNGRVAGELPRADTSEERLLRMAAGV